MHIMHRDCNSPHSVYKSCIEDVTAHIEDATAHVEDATSHTVTVTVQMAPGTIKPPFEPTATASEKIAKPFLPICAGG